MPCCNAHVSSVWRCNFHVDIKNIGIHISLSHSFISLSGAKSLEKKTDAVRKKVRWLSGIIHQSFDQSRYDKIFLQRDRDWLNRVQCFHCNVLLFFSTTGERTQLWLQNGRLFIITDESRSRKKHLPKLAEKSQPRLAESVSYRCLLQTRNRK